MNDSVWYLLRLLIGFGPVPLSLMFCSVQEHLRGSTLNSNKFNATMAKQYTLQSGLFQYILE